MQGQVVILEFPDTGHINPSLPIVFELSRRLPVTYFLPERFRQLVESSGARWHRWDPPKVTEEMLDHFLHRDACKEEPLQLCFCLNRC